MIEDITNRGLQRLTRQSSYSGSSRSIVELFTSGLQIDHSYTSFISVVEEETKVVVSVAVNFSMS